ncbi:autoinducer binding domain-containing protein [Vibrio vulnificus]|uniref:helix-turn-helix transcriptional regulator n=1 Tax=Vibrio vulnificus TaxID=672 RepID=UPI0030EC116E
MPNINELELCIELLNSAKTPEEAFSYFCAILAQSGYDRITYSLVTDHPSLDLPKQHGLVTSYPEDWMKYYNEHDYMNVDPVVQKVLTCKTPFFWSDLINEQDLLSDSLHLMNQAAESGLNSGIAFSLHGEPGEVVGMGVARSDSYEDSKDYDFLAKVYLLGTYFHETYRDMLIKEKNKLPLVTDREKDIIYWGAEGKTDPEIAIILGISVNTVRFHWKSIFKKLDARGRSYAVTKSIRLGIIVPELVLPPYRSR